jgi:hypothetical protein
VSVESDIARARKKPVAEDKLKELLVKARKDATASFTTSKLVAILDALGWTLEPIFGWTPQHYMYQGEETFVTEWTGTRPNDAQVAEMEKRRQKFIDASADLPPANEATVGVVVVNDVGPLKTGTDGIRYFHRRQWYGTGGVKITSPRGDEVELLPDHHDVGRGWKYVTEDYGFASGGDTWGWLKKAGIEDDIARALGVEKHVPAAQRTRENTGTCAHCWGNYKLERGRLVLHGYKRPRYGFVVGQCRGVGFEPLEKSPDGAEDALKSLHGYLAEARKSLAELESGQVEWVMHGKRKVERGAPLFDIYVKDEARGVKRAIEEIERDVTLYGKVIAVWHERSMPKEGELQRGPRFFTKP